VTCSSGSAAASTLPTLDATLDNFWENAGTVHGEGEGLFGDPFARMSDAACAEPMMSVDFAPLSEDFSMPMLSIEPPLALNDVGTFTQWAEEVEY